MIVSIHQPAYLPWNGLLDRIRRSDLFIVLDHVAFDRSDFVHRQRVKGRNGGLFWLTIPFQHRNTVGIPLPEVQIDEYWRILSRKHRKSLSSIFGELLSGFYPEYSGTETSLLEVCTRGLLKVLEFSRIETPIAYSSKLLENFPYSPKGSRLVQELCHLVKADRYLSGPLGMDYLDQCSFHQAGLKVDFHETRSFVPYFDPRLLPPVGFGKRAEA